MFGNVVGPGPWGAWVLFTSWHVGGWIGVAQALRCPLLPTSSFLYMFLTSPPLTSWSITQIKMVLVTLKSAFPVAFVPVSLPFLDYPPLPLPLKPGSFISSSQTFSQTQPQWHVLFPVSAGFSHCLLGPPTSKAVPGGQQSPPCF